MGLDTEGNEIGEIVVDTTVSDEIGDMLGDSAADDVVVDDTTDDVVDDSTVTPDTARDADDIVAPVVDNAEPVKDTPIVDEIENLDALRKRIAEMSTPAAAPVSAEEEINPLDMFKDDIAYITEENLQGIADNPLLLNESMNNIRRQTAEGILSIVPTLIHNAIKENADRQEMHNSFYGNNPELTPYKAYVSSVAGVIQSKYPDKSQEEILAATASSVKASLKLEVSTTPAKGNKGGGKPALRDSKGGGGRVAKEKVDINSQAAQIADMLT